MKNLFFVLAFMLIGTSFATNTVEKNSTYDVEDTYSFRGTCYVKVTFLVMVPKIVGVFL